MSSNTAGMDWNDQAISTLRALWAAGHSTAAIGRRMGVTKNAIVGKAHRLDLPARSSPIRSTPLDRPRSAPRIRPPASILNSLPHLACQPVPPPVTSVAPVSTPAPEPSIACPAWLPSPDRHCGCRWPIGEPGKAGFRFCGDEPAPAKPYCASHCRRAYVRLDDDAPAGAAA